MESISSFSDNGAAEKNLTKASWKRNVGFSHSMKGNISNGKKIKSEISFVYLLCRESTCIFVLEIHFKVIVYKHLKVYKDYFLLKRYAKVLSARYL